MTSRADVDVDVDERDPRILSVQRGEAVLRWMGEASWVGGVEVLVSTRAYTGFVAPWWLPVERVSTGATPYPVKCAIPGFGNGQWAIREVLAVRVLDDVIHALPDGRLVHEGTPPWDELDAQARASLQPA